MREIDGVDLTIKEIERINYTLDLLQPEIESILDVGCRDGRVTNTIESAKVVGIDVVMESLKNAKHQRILAAAESLPFQQKSFDCIICTEVLEHLSLRIYEQTLRNIAVIAKKYILLSVPYSENLNEGRVSCSTCGLNYHIWGHVRSYHHIDDLNFIEGFDCIRLRFIGHRANGSNFLTDILSRKKETSVFSLSRCPSCGTKSQRTKRSISFPRFILMMNEVIRRIKRMLRKTNPNWVVILYKRKIST